MEIRRPGAGELTLNLLLINYEYPPVGGGAANACWHLARELAGLGHKVCVLTSAFGELRGTVIEDSGVNVVRVQAFRSRRDRGSILQMIAFVVFANLRLMKLAREYEIDRSIAFFTIPCAPLALRLKRRRNTDYAISLRGGDVPGHVPGLALFHRLVRGLRRSSLRHAKAVVANGEGLARSSEAADPFPVRIIPNGVDTEFFRPAENREAVRIGGLTSFQCIFVGRLHPEKNLPFFFRAAAPLAAELKEEGVHLQLHLVGDGADRALLEQLTDELQLDVTFHGWCERETTARLYREADCLFNPSLYEGMANVVLEAMASALPVLASDVPGNAGLVRRDSDGLLFALEDEADLREKLGRLARDENLRKRFGKNGRRRAVSDFSWRSVAEGYLELLQ